MATPRMTPDALRAAKRAVWRCAEKPSVSWGRLMRAVEQRVAEVKNRGPEVVPSVDFADVQRGAVPAALVKDVKARGVCVLRSVIPRGEAEGLLRSAKEYVYGNGYAAQEVSDGGNAVFFTGGVPQIYRASQIYGVYWSQAQVAVRQHPHMATAQGWLGRLWSCERADGSWAFDPERTATYADRLRIRTPGDVSGLPAHVDGGSIERWVDGGYREYYAKVFSGDWEAHDGWHGGRRADCAEWPAPNVCTVFRLFQGFTALSCQGPGDGTLQLVPFLNESVAYLLLRALQDDVPEDDMFAAAFEGKQHQLTEQWHAPLLEGLVTIPTVYPGDTVWWHPDIVHAVERVHGGTEDAAVAYVPASPLCVKNAAYLTRQLDAMRSGRAAPDFPQEDRELSYSGRATEGSLTRLGQMQMGALPWEADGAAPPRRRLLADCAAALASSA